jgi:hypothetical protein
VDDRGAWGWRCGLFHSIKGADPGPALQVAEDSSGAAASTGGWSGWREEEKLQRHQASARWSDHGDRSGQARRSDSRGEETTQRPWQFRWRRNGGRKWHAAGSPGEKKERGEGLDDAATGEGLEVAARRDKRWRGGPGVQSSAA